MRMTLRWLNLNMQQILKEHIYVFISSGLMLSINYFNIHFYSELMCFYFCTMYRILNASMT